MIDDAAGDGELAVFPTGQLGDFAHGHLAADGLEAVGRNGRAFNAVTQRAVRVVPILENEEFTRRRLDGIGPLEIVERNVRGAAWRQEQYLPAVG